MRNETLFDQTIWEEFQRCFVESSSKIEKGERHD
jgi:hypothetical protein